MGKTDYSQWCKEDKDPRKSETCSHRIQIAKNNAFAYRTISLVNPYLYYVLVREITKCGNWKIIKGSDEGSPS